MRPRSHAADPYTPLISEPPISAHMRYLRVDEGAHIAGYALPRYRAFHIGGKRKLESDHVYAMILATYVECRWRGEAAAGATASTGSHARTQGSIWYTSRQGLLVTAIIWCNQPERSGRKQYETLLCGARRDIGHSQQRTIRSDLCRALRVGEPVLPSPSPARRRKRCHSGGFCRGLEKDRRRTAGR